MPSLVIALFLVAHGLIHASFLSPAPAPKPGAPAWPFDVSRSWLLTPMGIAAPVTRALGIALIAVVIAAFAVAALALVGLLGSGLFVPGVVAGSVASIALLVLFFHPWLVAGLVIDAVLLVAVLLAGWRPGGTGG